MLSFFYFLLDFRIRVCFSHYTRLMMHSLLRFGAPDWWCYFSQREDAASSPAHLLVWALIPWLIPHLPPQPLPLCAPIKQIERNVGQGLCRPLLQGCPCYCSTSSPPPPPPACSSTSHRVEATAGREGRRLHSHVFRRNARHLCRPVQKHCGCAWLQEKHKLIPTNQLMESHFVIRLFQCPVYLIFSCLNHKPLQLWKHEDHLWCIRGSSS